MALPAALAAKLSKRGLITDVPETPIKPVVECEIPHNYKGILSCPNKNNIYHECTNWCQAHWKGILTPDLRYARNMRRMLERYPLPHNWTEVYDKGLGKYYFWNMESDLVSWLPPRHPKAIAFECAAKLRMKLHLRLKESAALRELEKRKEHKDHHHRERRHRDRRNDESRRHEDKDRHRKKSKHDNLDPMDPSAYSDIPRGTWSDGLEYRSKADSTASGALYQQRPYPSPGDVLIGNKQKSKRNS